VRTNVQTRRIVKLNLPYVSTEASESLILDRKVEASVVAAADFSRALSLPSESCSCAASRPQLKHYNVHAIPISKQSCLVLVLPLTEICSRHVSSIRLSRAQSREVCGYKSKNHNCMLTIFQQRDQTTPARRSI